MERPLGLTLLAIGSMLNGILMLAVGVWTLMGSNFLFTPSGYGPNRIAIATLLGPFASYAGWVCLGLGVIVGLIGLGLFALKAWARFILLAVLVVVSVFTVVEIGSGLTRSYWGVVFVGLLKLVIYAVVLWYLNRDGVRRKFSSAR
jgi:hypothetical protein